MTRGLALTTSTALIGVALVDDDGVVAEYRDHHERRHAEDLVPAIAEVCRAAGVELADLDRLVVDVGPGRFTGLRVGLTTARTLARALDLDIVGVTSLEAVADAAARSADLDEVTAVIDARRGEVFHQPFRIVDGRPEPAADADVAPPDAVGGTGPVAGDGAVRYHDVYAGRTVIDADPEPESLWRLAVGRAPDEPPGPLPRYLRDADAAVGSWTTRPGVDRPKAAS